MSILRNHSGTSTWAFATLAVLLAGCSSSNKNSGGNNGTCEQGATRECVGSGACKGAQICQADSSWTTCDCGSAAATGGAGSGGNSSASSTTSPAPDVGGNNSQSGGAATTVASTTNPATGGATSSSTAATGGAIAATGGVTSIATTGTTAAPTGGAAAATGGSTSISPNVGGTAPVVTGGSTSISPNVGGATGAGGTSTAGGSSASPYFVYDKGWTTDAAHNVQGPLYTYADEGGSTITPDCGTSGDCFNAQATTTSFCVEGQVAQALDPDGYDCELTSDSCDWSTYWGAAVAINLNQDPTATDPSAWDASAYTGVSFKIAVDELPPNLRVYLVLTDDTQFCYQFTASKSYTLTWSQFHTNCYQTGGSAPTAADLKKVKKIAWQSGTNASNAGFFSYCVSDLKVTP